MTSITKLGLQGFAFGVALTGGGCMPQNQDQIEQLRAELTALKTEVAALKANAPAASATQAEQADEQELSAAAAAASGEHTPDSTPSSAIDWEVALEKHNKEERDLSWSRMREPDLFTAAKAHIKLYGASLNGVRCKTTTCLITVNVPKKPKAEYAVMTNPWAGADMLAHSKSIYSGRTLWSYLLTRHDKDTKEAGAERVNPIELAKSNPELVHAPVLVEATSLAHNQPEQKPASTSAPTAAGAEATKPAASAEAAKPAAAPSAAPQQSTAVTKAAEPAKPAQAKTEAAAPTQQPTAKPAAVEGSKPTEVAAAKPAQPNPAEAKTAAPKPASASAPAAPKPASQPAPETKTAPKPTEVKPVAAPAVDTKPAATAAPAAPAAAK